MKKHERDEILSKIADDLAKLFPNLYGSVKFNFQGGNPRNVNLDESIILKLGRRDGEDEDS